MKTWLQSILLLRDDKQQVVTNGYPYLRVDSIAGCTVKGLDVQVLLDPLEEDLNLPSFSIQLCNSDCINREVISEESIDFPVSKVLIYNKPEVVRILLGSIKSCKLYCLIGDKSSLSINFPRLDDCVQHIILGSGDKPRMVLMKVLIERVKFHIALIHKIVGICHDRYFIHNLGIMNRGLCKADKYRNGSVQVHQGVHFKATLAMMESCPWTQCQTQLNGATVKSTNHFIKVNPKLFSFVQFLSLLYQDIAKVLVDTPILFLVRLCKCRFGHNLKSRPIQVLRTKIKSSLNISQATAISELRKAHYQKLISAIELYGMSVTFIPFDALAEFILGEERHKLREDCFTFIHSLQELALMPFRKLTSSNRKIIFAL